MTTKKQPSGDADPVTRNDERYFKELELLNVPYSDDELAIHLKCRELKCAYEERHSFQFKLITAAGKWLDFIHHDGPKPRVDIGAIIMKDAKEAGSGNFPKPMRVFCDTLISYRCQMLPHMCISSYCSQSAAKLHEALEKLLPRPELEERKQCEIEIYELLNNKCVHEEAIDDCENYIRKLYRRHAENTRAYGAELAAFLKQKVNEHHLRQQGQSPLLPATVRDIHHAVTTIKENTASAAKTTIKKLSAKITEERKTPSSRGPKSPAKQRQINKVIDLLIKASADRTLLPSVLRGKEPKKWIRHCCTQIFNTGDNGYLSYEHLYQYCHANAAFILSRAGL